jgi:hypothetical protein
MLYRHESDNRNKRKKNSYRPCGQIVEQLRRQNFVSRKVGKGKRDVEKNWTSQTMGG